MAPELDLQNAAQDIDMDFDAWAAKAGASNASAAAQKSQPESPALPATPGGSRPEVSAEDPAAKRISKALQVAAFPANELLRFCSMDDEAKESLKEQVKSWSLSTSLQAVVADKTITLSWAKPEAGQLTVHVEGDSIVRFEA